MAWWFDPHLKKEQVTAVIDEIIKEVAERATLEFAMGIMTPLVDKWFTGEFQVSSHKNTGGYKHVSATTRLPGDPFRSAVVGYYTKGPRPILILRLNQAMSGKGIVSDLYTFAFTKDILTGMRDLYQSNAVLKLREISETFLRTGATPERFGLSSGFVCTHPSLVGFKQADDTTFH